MGAVANLRIGVIGFIRSVSGSRLLLEQLAPELGELPGQLLIIQVGEPLASDDDQIPATQLGLMKAKAFPNLAFDAIAFDREFDTLLADHQTQSRKRKIVPPGQQQNVVTRCLAGGGVEDRFELVGTQQTLFPAEASTHHLKQVQTVRRLRPLARRRDRT